MNWKALQKPFSKGEVKTKTVSGRTEHYITARQVMNRLDEICGPAGWYDVYRTLDNKHVECTLFIKCGEDFIGKTDVGEVSNFAPMKGGYSDAFKRAAVRWGIGRELYQEGTVNWGDEPAPERQQSTKTAPKTRGKQQARTPDSAPSDVSNQGRRVPVELDDLQADPLWHETHRTFDIAEGLMKMYVDELPEGFNWQAKVYIVAKSLGYRDNQHVKDVLGIDSLDDFHGILGSLLMSVLYNAPNSNA
jgi:hypothetical protein